MERCIYDKHMKCGNKIREHYPTNLKSHLKSFHTNKARDQVANKHKPHVCLLDLIQFFHVIWYILISDEGVTVKTTALFKIKSCLTIKISKCTSWVAHQGQSLLSVISAFCCWSITEVRLQLSDQLRCLDQRVDCHLGMVVELQEYYRRHAEIEAELSRNLDKVDKQIRARHKAEKQRSVPALSCIALCTVVVQFVVIVFLDCWNCIHISE